MIIGLGIDVVELARMECTWQRFGMRFAERILHPEEINGLRAPEARYLASRFAVKEAAVKALGTGFAHGLAPSDILVRHTEGGKPQLVCHGPAEELLRKRGVSQTFLSISHERSVAVAVVILEG